MSGAAGGSLIGLGALVLLPVIVEGAIIAATAYGIIKAGAFIAKKASEYVEKRSVENELTVSRCSRQLDDMYGRMRNAVRDEVQQQAQNNIEMSEFMTSIGNDILKYQKTKPSAEQLDKKIKLSREQIDSERKRRSEVVRSEIANRSKKKLKEITDEIERSNKERDEIINWSNKQAASIQMQKSGAQDMMRDAEASIRMLKSMSISGKDDTFIHQVRDMERVYQNSVTMFEQGMYQSAFSNARTVIRTTAILSSEHIQDEIEKDMLLMDLQAKYEGLLEELKKRRYIEFEDETTKKTKHVIADLYKFSQGKYMELIEQLENRKNELSDDSKTQRLTIYEIQKEIDDFDDNVQPLAEHIVERSTKIMSGYYERLHVMEVVADFMSEQDYKMDWAMPVGGDLSQKLVVHFMQKSTGNTVSVTLDGDAKNEDVAKMAMEVLTFYGNGREVTEAEKKQLRDHLTEAINKAGYGGELACTGNVNQPSDQVEMNRKESVRQMSAKQVI